VGGALLAEGIEELDELNALLELDVHLGQGFLLGLPSFGWSEVTAAPGRLIADKNRAERRVVSLAVHLPTIQDADVFVTRTGVVSGLALVVADGDARGLWVRDSVVSPHGCLRPLFCIPITSTVRFALCRAMERPAETRLDPLACTDQTGEVVAGVTVDALMKALVSQGLPEAHGATPEL